VDLSYTEEQELFRKSVREFVADRLPPERLAEIADGDEGWDPALWKEAAELGLAGVAVPEDLGGAGMGIVEESVVAEELGRAVFPGPWLGSVVLAQPPLAEAPDLLRGVASGERVATVAALDSPVAVSGTTLTGDARGVVDLGPADVIVVAGQGPEGASLYTVEADESERRVLATVDGTRRLGELSLRGASAGLLAEPARAEAILGRAATRAAALRAAEAVGVGGRAVELAIEHARSREQFGRAVGSFQAVSHQIADAYVDVENARSLAMWAVAAIESDDPDAELAARTAERRAARTAVAAAERAIQVHGGIGFTWEHVLHRLYKRALWLRLTAPAPRTA
jgi:alkylation response protein AidB-like acyl-CoA dehydrogenase